MGTTQRTSIERYAVLLIAFAFSTTLLLSSGCSSGEATPDPTAKVAGTVTVKGKPLKSGTLMLMSFQNGGSGQGTIDKSGKFEFAESLPPGEYTAFFTEGSVPEKYLSETSSGYTVTLTEGANDLKIALE